MSPDSIAGTACGSFVTLTFTATFHIPAGANGGIIQFEYTLNNGRSSTNASVVVNPREATKIYTFTSSGVLPPDHTYPGVAEVMVTSPNAVHSPQILPNGSCGVAAPPFQVRSVDLAVSPASLNGTACGPAATFTYTATFHLAPGSPGGTIQFSYTVNNGRSSTNASITVAAGQTRSWQRLPAIDQRSPSSSSIGRLAFDFLKSLSSSFQRPCVTRIVTHMPYARTVRTCVSWGQSAESVAHALLC